MDNYKLNDINKNDLENLNSKIIFIMDEFAIAKVLKNINHNKSVLRIKPVWYKDEMWLREQKLKRILHV
jgi:hypothetical protein